MQTWALILNILEEKNKINPTFWLVLLDNWIIGNY